MTITKTHEVADGLYGAIVKATKPVAAPVPADLPAMPALPRAITVLDAAESGCGCGSGGCCS